jgi:hypothetical protein
MDTHHGHTSWTHIMDTHHGHTSWTHIMDTSWTHIMKTHHRQTSWTHIMANIKDRIIIIKILHQTHGHTIHYIHPSWTHIMNTQIDSHNGLTHFMDIIHTIDIHQRHTHHRLTSWTALSTSHTSWTSQKRPISWT